MSLVTFLHSGDIHVVLPGDLEPAGWRRLLSYIDFQQQLSTVNVFVAPHHGRETGYLAEVFHRCEPKIIVVSDGCVQYDTQKGVYGSREASGILLAPHGRRPTLLGSDPRHVLTTRRDTTPLSPAIVIQQIPGQPATVSTAHGWGFL